MSPIPFEEKKYCRVRTLCQRWDCSPGRVYHLARKGLLRMWHPEGVKIRQGMMIEVESVLELEGKGKVNADEV